MIFSNLINLLTLLVSIGGLFIAYKALSTWKEELKAKNYMNLIQKPIIFY